MCRVKGFVIALPVLMSKLFPHEAHKENRGDFPSLAASDSIVIHLYLKSPLAAARASKRAQVSVQATLQPRNSFSTCLLPNQVLQSTASRRPACIHQYSLLSGLALLPPFKLLTLARKLPPLLGSTGPPLGPSLVTLLSSIPPVGVRLGLLKALDLPLT